MACVSSPTSTVFATVTSTILSTVTTGTTRLVVVDPDAIQTITSTTVRGNGARPDTTETVTRVVRGGTVTSEQPLTSVSTILETTSSPVETLFAPCTSSQTSTTTTSTTTSSTTTTTTTSSTTSSTTTTTTPSSSSTTTTPARSTITEVTTVSFSSSSTAPASSSSSALVRPQSQTSNVAAIAGGVGGGVGGLILLALLIFCCCCRKRRKDSDEAFSPDSDPWDPNGNRAGIAAGSGAGALAGGAGAAAAGRRISRRHNAAGNGFQRDSYQSDRSNFRGKEMAAAAGAAGGAGALAYGAGKRHKENKASRKRDEQLDYYAGYEPPMQELTRANSSATFSTAAYAPSVPPVMAAAAAGTGAGALAAGAGRSPSQGRAGHFVPPSQRMNQRNSAAAYGGIEEEEEPNERTPAMTSFSSPPRHQNHEYAPSVISQQYENGPTMAGIGARNSHAQNQNQGIPYLPPPPANRFEPSRATGPNSVGASPVPSYRSMAVGGAYSGARAEEPRGQLRVMNEADENEQRFGNSDSAYQGLTDGLHRLDQRQWNAR